MRSAALRAAVAAFALLLALLGAGPVSAAPKSELWERWLPHDPASTRAVDHAPWQTFLDRYVLAAPDGSTRVAYGRVTAEDRAALAAYLDALSAVAVGGLARGEQRAYWINLYNALTVRVVLDHFPVASIRDIDISPGLFADGPWGRKLVRVEGEALSLDDVEHRILRPIWRDPRIHYALNCASLGCPDLLPRAFTSANAEALLDEGARRFVNHPRGAAPIEGRLTVSSIYVWFKEDFGGDDAGVIAHLRAFADPALAERLAGVRRIGDHAYDWRLNAAP
ncbi:MAG: DUF547 domain-containing protein [Alphaproteobacteria bacterium]|nr:DUF547 domain-containing protein [Alphaproteobacteria bacterium]